MYFFGKDDLSDVFHWADPRRLHVDDTSGALQYSMSLCLPDGRSEFTPDLALAYDSNRRNTPFGWGWDIPVPCIAQRNAESPPNQTTPEKYVGYAITESAGAVHLMPALRQSEGWVEDRFAIGDYAVQRYRSQFEPERQRIEHWIHQPTGQSHWRITDRNNVTSIYGNAEESRIADPTDPTFIAQWLLAERYDDRGNVMRYIYKREDDEGFSSNHAEHKSLSTQGAYRYLKRVQYANVIPHDRQRWHFEIVFDYGEHDPISPTVFETHPWQLRPDPVTSRALGFELRVQRRCQRILIFHRFGELGEDPTLVSSFDFSYDESLGISQLQSIVRNGYISTLGTIVDSANYQPVKLDYGASPLDLAPFVLRDSGIGAVLQDARRRPQWIDLYGEGLAGIVFLDGRTRLYMRNLGGGRFADPEVLPDDVFFEDAQEREIVDLSAQARFGVMHSNPENLEEVIESANGGGVAKPTTALLDINGDGNNDIMVVDEIGVHWYPSLEHGRYDDPVVLKLPNQRVTRSHMLRAETHQMFFVADMTGDGLPDMVRVRTNEVTYWPSARGSTFEQPVTLVFDANDVAPKRVLLGDLTGTGTADLIYLADNEIFIWENHGGNTFGDMQQIPAVGLLPEQQHASVVDLFGSGSDCIVWVENATAARKNPIVHVVRPTLGQRRMLLTRFDNGIGGIAEVTYQSSTELRVADRERGIDQLMTIPKVVQLVAAITQTDAVVQQSQVEAHTFRHGVYDEQLSDVTSFCFHEKRSSSGEVVRRWYHGGVLFEGEELTTELSTEWYFDPNLRTRTYFHGNRLPIGHNLSANADIHRALRGQLLREEHYHVEPNLDAESIRLHNPIRVHEVSYCVTESQADRGGRHCAFSLAEQIIDAEFYGDVADPKYNHEIVRAYDALGFVTQRVYVIYPRRAPLVEAQQTALYQVIEASFGHWIDQSMWFRIGVPTEIRASTLRFTTPEPDELLDATGLQQVLSANSDELAQPQQWLRFRYWSNDGEQLLDQGQIESHGLLARVEQLMMNNRQLEVLQALYPAHYADDLASYLSEHCGYVVESSGCWSQRTTVRYDARQFYVPIAWTNSLGNITHVRCDATAMSAIEIENAHGARWTMHTHPRTRRLGMVIDPQGTAFARRFDALGVTLSVAMTPSNVYEFEMRDGLDEEAIEANSRDNPTEVLTHTMREPFQPGRPFGLRLRHREAHGDNETAIQEMRVFHDAYGRPLYEAHACGENRWRIHNANMQTAPFERTAYASSYFEGDPATALDIIATGPYVERVVTDPITGTETTHFGDGTSQQSRYGPWQREFLCTSDASIVSELDGYGRIVRQSPYEHAITPAHFEYDDAIAATAVDVGQSSPHSVLMRTTDGNVVMLRMSTGLARVMLTNCDGKPARSWLNDGAGIDCSYDASGRLIERVSFTPKEIGVQRDVVERVIWGDEIENELGHRSRLFGRVAARIYPRATQLIHNYDAMGNVISQSTLLGGLQDLDDIDYERQSSQSLMHELIESFHGVRINESTDAFGRVTRTKILEDVNDRNAAWSLHRSYGANGELQTISIEDDELLVLRNVVYDAGNRPINIQLSNDVACQHELDIRGRPSRITLKDPDDTSELVYAYDSLGRMITLDCAEFVQANLDVDNLGNVRDITKSHVVRDVDNEMQMLLEQQTFVRDPFGRLVEVTTKLAGKTETERIDFDNVTGLPEAYLPALADAQRIAITHDDHGNLVSLEDVFRCSWDNDLRLVAIDFADEHTRKRIEFSYDTSGVLIRQSTRYNDIVISDLTRVGDVWTQWACVEEECIVKDHTFTQAIGNLVTLQARLGSQEHLVQTDLCIMSPIAQPLCILHDHAPCTMLALLGPTDRFPSQFAGVNQKLNSVIFGDAIYCGSGELKYQDGVWTSIRLDRTLGDQCRLPGDYESAHSAKVLGEMRGPVRSQLGRDASGAGFELFGSTKDGRSANRAREYPYEY